MSGRLAGLIKPKQTGTVGRLKEGISMDLTITNLRRLLLCGLGLAGLAA